MSNDRNDAIEAAALSDLQTWCTDQGSRLGAVYGYDYRSGEEAAYRHVAIEIGKRLKALAPSARQRGENLDGSTGQLRQQARNRGALIGGDSHIATVEWRAATALEAKDAEIVALSADLEIAQSELDTAVIRIAELESALAAETERCAGIADNYSFARDIDWWLGATKKDVSAEACRSIAAAIRGVSK